MGKFLLDRPLPQRHDSRRGTFYGISGRTRFQAETASLGQIYARAQQLGFGLAAAEIAPQLRLQYTDQPTGEFLIIGMEPIKRWKGELVILTVANGGAGLLLIGQDGSADAQISVVSRFLFVRSNEAALAEGTNRPQHSSITHRQKTEHAESS